MRRTLIANRARSMRKVMTEPEVMLWSHLRGRRADKPTFRRQHPFGPFIIDFYCPSARLAVEVDGNVHGSDEARERDAARDRWLDRQGLSVLRIPAAAIYKDLAAVADAILRRAEHERLRLAPSTPRSSLRSAGGPPPAAARGR